MSCNYAEGLSPYANKGKLGGPERPDGPKKIAESCKLLAEWITSAKHVVVHTGAGISTASGIPDFRGPNGVWTLEKRGEKPKVDIRFEDAKPTRTHMALKHLIDKGLVHYIVSQNIDGLHMRSGVQRKYLAELHGNMFTEECPSCSSQFVRQAPAPTVGRKCLEVGCHRFIRGRPCRGKLHDTILDWDHGLPGKDLELSNHHSSLADLNICLGTTLQIIPSGHLPFLAKKYGGKVVIVNLQKTKRDKDADLVIHAYVDDVFVSIMKTLGLDIPAYDRACDPTKSLPADGPLEWTLLKEYVEEVQDKYRKMRSSFKGRKRGIADNSQGPSDSKMPKAGPDNGEMNLDVIDVGP